MRLIIAAIRPDIKDHVIMEVLTFYELSQGMVLRTGRGVVLRRLKKRGVTQAGRQARTGSPG